MLCILSTIQKFMVDAPFVLKAYLIPFLFGGLAGAVIGVWDLRLRNAMKSLQEYEKTLEHSIAKKTEQLKLLNTELSRQALYDGLTNTRNYRDYKEHIKRVWARWKRGNVHFTVMMCDLDYFKNYNDTYGHLKGDDCLKAVAKALSEVVRRPNDYLARYGGEEFVIILPDTGLDGAVEMAERARAVVQQLGIEHESSECSGVVTLSIGVAATDRTKLTESYTSLVSAADEALYEAKNAGRNKVRVFEQVT